MSLTTSSGYTSTFHGWYDCGFALNGSPIARDALVAEVGLDLALSASASIGLT